MGGKAEAYARSILGSDLTRRFTDEEDRTHLRLTLEDRGVSPEIIDRVMRLNPVLVEGQMLRGIHYKRQRENQRMWGYVPKGEFLRLYGREAFAKLPRREIKKHGRRVFVMRRGAL